MKTEKKPAPRESTTENPHIRTFKRRAVIYIDPLTKEPRAACWVLADTKESVESMARLIAAKLSVTEGVEHTVQPLYRERLAAQATRKFKPRGPQQHAACPCCRRWIAQRRDGRFMKHKNLAKLGTCDGSLAKPTKAWRVERDEYLRSIEK